MMKLKSTSVFVILMSLTCTKLAFAQIGGVNPTTGTQPTIGTLPIQMPSLPAAESQPPTQPSQQDQSQAPATSAPAGGGQQQPKADCEEAYKQCEKDAEDARKACATQDMQAGMNPAAQQQAQQLMSQGNQLNQNVGSNGGSIAAQCQNQADLSKILSALSALKGTACTTMVGSCTSSCEEVAKSCQQAAQQQPAKSQVYNARARAAEAKGKVCSGLGGNGMAALGQAMGLLGNMFQNQACANQMAGSSPTPLPNDCTNPQFAAVTPACICAPAGSNPSADPTNAICNNGQSVGGITPGLNSSAGPASPPQLMSDSSEGSIIRDELGKAKTATGNTEIQNGGGASAFGAAGNSNLGRGGNDMGEGRMPSSIDKNVIMGQSGGGGGGLMAGGGGGGSGGFGGGNGRSEGADKIDLSQWLPKGKYKALNIGGMSIKPYDGITGPMGPSIWEKVSNQYQQQKPRLIPER